MGKGGSKQAKTGGRDDLSSSSGLGGGNSDSSGALKRVQSSKGAAADGNDSLRASQKDAGGSRIAKPAATAASAAAIQAAVQAATPAGGGGSGGGSQNGGAHGGAAASGHDELDPTWDDPVLYTRTNQTVGPSDFEALAVVGKGSFGKVMQVRKKGGKDDGRIFAMKILRKDAIIARKQVAHTKAEKDILQKIQHPFIVRLNYAFQTEDKLYMVLDYINGGELFFHLKKEGKFSEARVRFYAAEIISALGHLHKFGIVYRDLKPENILLNAEGHITITDFGLSKEITNEEGTHTFCGTPEYLAPEVLKGQGHGTPVDWWSLGTLVYEMLTGLPPFYSQNINIMYQKILNGELRFPSYVSPEAQSLLEGLLTREVDKRLGSGPKDADEIKSHPWFSSVDWARLDRKEIEPPFKPKVSGDLDLSQIDTVFTQEAAVDSYAESHLSNTAAAHDDQMFSNFNFQADQTATVGGNGAAPE